MEAKLKALKVAELKEILTKSSTPIPTKANKADLIAKILATPDALKLAGGGEAAASAPAPAALPNLWLLRLLLLLLQLKQLRNRIDRFDWEGTGAKPDTGASAEAKPAEPASTTESTPAPTKEDASKSTQEETKSADGDAKPAEGGAPKVGEKGGCEEAGGEEGKKEEKPKAVKISAKEAAPNDDDAKLAARAARFGISTAPKAAAGGSADPAEDEKRKKREARFGAPCQYEPHACTRYSYSRLSSIPTPGSRPGTAQSGIPGRPRSSTGTNTTMAPRDSEAMSMALQDAIKAHDPTRYANNELSPQLPSAHARQRDERDETPGIPPIAPRKSTIQYRPESQSAGHEFEVGDAVKIESLGMEGTLRFMGEIDGKNGLWAGVELAPAFAGKEKTMVQLRVYAILHAHPSVWFTLPNKLSAPWGDLSLVRPRQLRTIPMAALLPLYQVGQPFFCPRQDHSCPGKEKDRGHYDYRWIPRKQLHLHLWEPQSVGPCLLHERDQAWLNPATQPQSSKTYNPMPPPPVPTDSPRKMRQNTITPTSLNSAGADDDRQSLMSALDANNQAIQDKIALLMAGTRTGSNPASPVMRTDDERVAQLEKEIEQLRAEVRDKTASIAEEAAVLNAAIERAVALEEDKRLALERVAELEVPTLRWTIPTPSSRRQTRGSGRKGQRGRDQTVRGRIRLGDPQVLTRVRAQGQTERVAALETQVSTLETDLQFERRELGQQVDELRFAGQETIALYEERISGMEGRRYELEDLVADLESQIEALKKNGSVPRPGGTTAAEIDNESLREQREDESARSRIAKAKEGEQAAWKECLELRKEVDNLKRDEGLAKAKIEELVEALREGAVTLEAARGDVEGLRAEVADLESLKTPGTQEGDGQPVEVVQLKRELEDIKKALEVAKKNEADLRATLEGLEKDKAEVWKQRAAEHQKTVSELQKKGTSAEQLRAESPNTRRDSVDSDSSRGLARGNRLLVSSTLSLVSKKRSANGAMRRLEATIDDKLDTKAEGTDGERIKRIETENELMKTKITEMEQKHARVVLDLNKEITELENLVESKIYREDDLERELERYKEKLARAQRPSGESMLTNGTSKSKSNIKDHDGMDCPLLHDGGEDEPTVKISAAIGKDKKGWCADCEEFGHEVDECPNSQEVF
ncbi:hypothetical protein RHS01_04070 [Rhizoctonia solani]|uniref:CAP-Gly domain-containing protein n=1 Tax=Rhizoctonia solani TaxID=456999 RepID=A0A8H7M2W3_9AGAM|nr:hypothetical protein RHS01_04070 [Rhizoctonia solani]